tara:strand:+ start:1240 stop:2130 length:891 start_codon:yes stop_codon:yes gene_type:complete
MSFSLNVVNTGVTANDGLGDPLRTAFSKSHDNDVILSGELNTTGYQIVSGFGGMSLMGLQNQFDDLSGNLQFDYQSSDDAVSGNVVSTGQSLLSTIDDTGQYILDVAVTGEGISGMHRKTITFDIPASGESVIITGSKTGTYYFNNGPDPSYNPSYDNNDALYQGKYSLSLTERHQYHHYYSNSPLEDWQASGAFPARMFMRLPAGGNQDSMVYTFQFPVTNIGNPYEGGSHEYTVMLSGDRAEVAGTPIFYINTPMWVITRTSEHTYAPFTGHGANHLWGNHYRRHYLVVNLVEY